MTSARVYPALLLSLLLMAPLVGSVAPIDEARFVSVNGGGEGQVIKEGWSTTIPAHSPLLYDERPWWQVTRLDSDRNKIHDSLQVASGPVWVGVSYEFQPGEAEIAALVALGHPVKVEIPAVDALLIGQIDASEVAAIAELAGVVMVERYGQVVFYGDIQTPAVKARNSTEYPVGAWDLGVTGKGVNIALTDTGVDDEHPGLTGKFVAGYDAVCYMHTDPACIIAGGRQDDGSFNPDDGNQHGTACMGMASATGIEADGSQSNFTGSAPDARLIDVRIGTDVGAGPFENYFLSQEFYESAMNGVQWIIDNSDTAWNGVDEENYGIDIISLSWGITSHENGGSDGSDMHSRILDDATLAGVTVSVAAGNDGPDNDGLSGMGSSSLSITVGATDDMNTIIRDDDGIASYSSRGPRRDNGDGNPINEMKPEISAPGTNIIQAEGCVTSGGCNNFAGGDASDNTYTGRGSGTSYATPAVSGVIALVIEANPELEPLQIREVIKQTAERRGPASQPEFDPYWNADFGWGMIDAKAAVTLAQHLNATGQTLTVDSSLQNHLLNKTTEGGTIILTGHAWTQSATLDSVQYRIDGGAWHEATYEEEIDTLAPLTPFNWTVAVSASSLLSANHSIEVRAVSGDSHSLPVIAIVTGTGGAATEGMSAMVIVAGASLLLILLAFAGVFVVMRRSSDIEGDEGELSTPPSDSSPDNEIDEVVEAELLPEDDFDSKTVAELKLLLSERGLPVSGNKQNLLGRLREQSEV